ncbi:MAG: amidohydrolase family protein [Rheinheimera sp.]|nr:amidohydrolase family protein [Rheinheimera sp.]
MKKLRPYTTRPLLTLLLCQGLWSPGVAANTVAAVKNENDRAVLIADATIVTADTTAQRQVRQHRGFVLIEQGLIKSITTQVPPLPLNTHIINAKGKYLIPGLIDSHVHPYRVPGFHAGHYRQYPQWAEAWRQAEPRLYLWHGFTSLVDAGDWQQGLANKYYQAATSPTLYGVGATVRQLDGYGHNFYPKPAAYQALPNWIFNPTQQLPAGADPVRHQPAAAVQQVVRQHGIALKTFAEDGFSGAIPELVLPEQPLLQQLVQEAHKAGLPVMLHATSVNGYQLGVQAGVDIFAHGLWHFAYADFWSIEPPAAVTTVLAQLTAQQYVQPTVRVVLAEQQALEDELQLPEILKQALPPELLNWYQTEAGRWGRTDQLDFTAALKQRLPLPPVAAAASAQQLAKRMAQRALRMLQQMQSQQVQLILGTDTPSPDSNPVTIAGANGIAELQAWADAGVPLTDIFLAATARNARAFRLPAGEIQPGKVADLLLLDSNPLQSVQAYQQINHWIVRGKLMSSNDIFQSVPHRSSSAPAGKDE